MVDQDKSRIDQRWTTIQRNLDIFYTKFRIAFGDSPSLNSIKARLDSLDYEKFRNLYSKMSPEEIGELDTLCGEAFFDYLLKDYLDFTGTIG